MTFQWFREMHAGAEILRFTGHVGLDAPDLIAATNGVDAPYRDLPLVLDLTDLQGWGRGRSAIVAAVQRLAVHREVTIRAPHDRLTLWALEEAGLGALIDAKPVTSPRRDET
ncbi:hypothetical protein [Streptosporangium sp. NPDC000396]|uniref:hypothetical protein n=1 Tax=Streptosporangium sp. NPDC000396 TaxID=3366185 RepID=UPI0036AB3861